MQNNEFLTEVERHIEIGSAVEADTATRGVLQTLADHLAGNAPAKLAAQLPAEIGAFITAYKNDPDAAGEGFGVEEFIRRTVERGGFEDSAAAEKSAVAVLAAVRAAISDGEFAKMRGTLPAEYDRLFGT